MTNIPDKVKENVRAVLLSKTDGKGVLVNDFLKDYKHILKEPLMFKSLGYASLPEFLKAIPDVCRLDYNENIMAFKLFGIAKPNTYVSSFVRKAEGNVSEEDSEREDRSGRRRRNKSGELLQLGTNINEDWEPNCRGLYSLCFQNRFRDLNSSETVTVKFSRAGEVADVNIIPRMIFVRYRDCNAAKKALALWEDELGLKRADEKMPKKSGRSRADRGDDMLVKPRQRRNDSGRNSGKKNESDESDQGTKYAQHNGHLEDQKKESIWAKVRESETDSQIEKETNKNTNSNTVVHSVVEKKDSIWVGNTEHVNDGLLGKAPGDSNSGRLDVIGQKKGLLGNDLVGQQKGILGEAPSVNKAAVMNGLLAGPVSPVPLGRAAVLGRQATGHSSYVNPGPISRPVIKSVNQQKPEPISPQAQAVPKLSPSTGGYLAQGASSQKQEAFNQLEDDKTAQENAKNHQTEDESSITQVYVGNFPFTATQDEFELLLKDYDFKSCKIVGCKNQSCKKYAFVDFTSVTEAERCIAGLNDTEFQRRNLKVGFGRRQTDQEKDRKAVDEGHLDAGVKNLKLSPKPNTLSPIAKVSPKLNQQPPSPKYADDLDDDDEMPPLEEDLPAIKRTVQNDHFKTADKKTGRQPGSYVPKNQQESPERMPMLETLSPEMPKLEPKTPPRSKQPPPVPIPQMPQPNDRVKVFDSRDLEDAMLHKEDDNDEDDDESVQLFISNFPYGTSENELLDLFQKQTVEQIVIMNSTVTNRSTYAFVTVKNIEQAQFAILQHDQSLIKGRRLTVGMATPHTKQKTRQEDPIARITCTVGACGDDRGRHVSVDDTLSQSSMGGGYMSETGGGYMSGYMSDGRDGYMSDMNFNRPDMDFGRMREDHWNTKIRMTQTLRMYAVIVSKLHGEADFQQPVNSYMTVYVTHVEDNGYFFWGQVLVDETLGPRKNIETLRRISQELQQSVSRPAPVSKLGRCAALYQGEWYRAWNGARTDDGRWDVFYVDYGNRAVLPPNDLCTTVFDIWNLPPIAKPFRLADAKRGASMKGMENKKVTLEITGPGNPQSNFVAHVHLVTDDGPLQ